MECRLICLNTKSLSHYASFQFLYTDILIPVCFTSEGKSGELCWQSLSFKGCLIDSNSSLDNESRRRFPWIF